MKILGIDLSTSVCGWAISQNGKILNAGFVDLSKLKTYKEKAYIIIDTLKNEDFDKINVEETLNSFARGKTSNHTIISLIKNKAVICYILEEYWKKPVNLCNVSTVRKKVLGKARLKLPNSKKSMPAKDFVKQELPHVVSNLSKFDKLNTRGGWDKRNADAYDAIIMSLYG